MQYYTYKIEGNEPIQLNVGNHRLHIEWRWNTVAQEQKDNLDRMLSQAAQSDPLMNNAGIVAREYDYLKYYTEVVPQDAAEQEAWLSLQYRQNTSFPTGAAAYVLRFGTYKGKLYVGTDHNGIYVSEDGETFTQNTSFLRVGGPSVYAFCVYRDKLYVGTYGESIYANSSCFVSEDGETFTPSTLPDIPLNALCVYRDKLYVGTKDNGIYVSEDGETFTQNTSFPTNMTLAAFCVYRDKLYAGTSGGGIYVSEDGFTFTQNTSFPISYGVYDFAVFNDKLYVPSGYRIYVSEDGEIFGRIATYPATTYPTVLGVFNDKLYVGTNRKGILVSEDGETFTQDTSFPMAPTDVYVQDFAVFDDKLYVGVRNNGIYTLEDPAGILPQSILRVGPSTAAALSLLRERVSLCTGLKEYNEELLEELHYQALITDENENRTVADVIPGGWFRDQDQYYALNFQSAMERIERDQLPLVTIYFEVYDGE